MDQLPQFPQGFTPAFLSEVLARDVVDVSQEPMGEGTGMMADIALLKFRCADDSNGSVVAKYASENPTNREVAMMFNLYERETRYFAEVDPLTEARSPEIYFTLRDGDNFVIVMEDLSDYEVGDQIMGADLRQSELAIDELAKLHASFWGKTDDFPWVPGIANSYHADNMDNFANQGWDNMVATFGDFLPQHIRDQKESFLPKIRALQEQRFAGPNTFLHGDYRMENLLYGTQLEHHPVAVIDWQGPLIGKGMFDVALFLGQSTRTEIRQVHERELLDRYMNGLMERGVTGLSEDALWEEYRRTMLYDWVYVTVVAGTLDTSNPTAFDWMSQMIARQVAASDDLEVFDLLP